MPISDRLINDIGLCPVVAGAPCVRQGDTFYHGWQRGCHGPENITRLRRFAIGIIKSKECSSVAQKMRELNRNTRLVFNYLKMTENACPPGGYNMIKGRTNLPCIPCRRYWPSPPGQSWAACAVTRRSPTGPTPTTASAGSSATSPSPWWRATSSASAPCCGGRRPRRRGGSAGRTKKQPDRPTGGKTASPGRRKGSARPKTDRGRNHSHKPSMQGRFASQPLRKSHRECRRRCQIFNKIGFSVRH